MSEQTEQAMADAIAAHIADEDGDLAVAWVVSVAAVMADDAESTSYSYWTPSSQPAHVTRGLLDVTQHFHRRHSLEGDG